MFRGILLSLLSTSLLLGSSIQLSLAEAIEILKSENLEIKSAGLKVDAAKEAVDVANGNHWGKLEFTQDFANSNDAGNVFGFTLASREVVASDFAIDTLNNPDTKNFFQSKLKYEIPLFTGFKISSYVEISKSIIKLKSLEKNQIINEKVYQLRKSYYDMALLHDSRKNLNRILTNIKVLEKMTERMIEVGYAKKVDLLEVEAKKASLKSLILEVESNEKLLYHYISFILSSKIDNITVPSTNVPMPSYSDNDILNNNLNIKMANSGLEIKKNMLNMAESSYYPTLGAFGELSTSDDTFLGGSNEHKAYTVGARLSWNIFNGGIDNSKIEQSRIEYLDTQTQVNLAKQGTTLQIAKIRTEIETADAKIVSVEKELTLSDAIYNNYAGRYREKLSSMSDVIIKQSLQIQKILELQQAKNRRNERIFALEKLANGENNDK